MMAGNAETLRTEFARIAVGILQRQDRIWIQKRPAGVHLADLWEFPGGKVEATETPAQALLRELHEEAGLTFQASHLRLLWIRPYAYPDRFLRLFFFLVPMLPEESPQGPGKWTLIADLHWSSFPPANSPILKWLRSGSCTLS